MMIYRVLLSFQIGLLLMSICGAETLYDVLGVNRTASQRQIEEAYKKLANWHLDKSDDSNAVETFMKIREAYDTLKDHKKRQTYDHFRCTSDTGGQPKQSRLTSLEHFYANELIFHEHNLYSSFYDKENPIDKYVISLREYETNILPNSHRKPCVIFAFTDCCWGCNTFEKYLQKLEFFGLCAATFNVETSGDLRTYFGIDTVPSLIAVSAGRVRHFNGSVTNQTLQNFTRSLFSPSTFTKIADWNFQEFLDGFEDNRVRVIFFGLKQKPATRFLAPALYYQDNIAFAYVYTGDPEARMLIEKYNVNKKWETLLLFKEETNVPVDISMQQFNTSTIYKVLEANKYLMLPRLSSQRHFDELCPHENNAKKRMICVVLITKKKKEHDAYRESFRNYSQRSKLAGHEHVMFSYIYEDIQRDFVSVLTKDRMQEYDTAMVAILWRMKERSLSYDWLETGWDFQRDREKMCEEKLENRLTVLLTTDSNLQYRTNLTELYNENGPTLFKLEAWTINVITTIISHLLMIYHKLLFWADRISSYLTSYDNVACMELLLFCMFYFAMGYLMWNTYGTHDVQLDPH